MLQVKQIKNKQNKCPVYASAPDNKKKVLFLHFLIFYCFSGLGADSKLPFQIRLLTAASKQKFGSRASSPARSSQNFAGFSNYPPNMIHGTNMAPMNFSDYMYMDKNHSMQNKTPKSNGFSIDEIMKH